MTFEEQHLRPSRFYKQLFDVWHEIHIREPDNTNEILNETLWCNHLIQVGDKPCCFSEMKEKGVLKLRDILNLDGSFKSKESIERSHNMTLNIMHYNSIKSAIPKTWLTQLRRRNKDVYFKETDNEGKIKINGKWQLIIKTTNKQYYWELMKRNRDKSKAIEKWEENYLHNFDWSEIFKLPYETTRETKLQSLQYQIINRYFPCGHNLNIWYSTNEYSCSFCNENESLEHYFYSCPYVKRFWKSFMNWWKTIYDCYIQLNVLDILFGIVNENNDNMIGCLNFCILLAKRYIKSVHENGNKDQSI